MIIDVRPAQIARWTLLAGWTHNPPVAGARSGAGSGLAGRFADAALDKFVLADHALGVDAQQYVHAVPGPLRDFGRIDAPSNQVDRHACRRF
jgi:hypothetical protein